MARVLITGMSGTGKSTVIRELQNRGFAAVDFDSPEYSHYAKTAGSGETEWLWREDRVRAVLESAGTGPLFVSGCASNQGRFYDRLDHIVLLSAPLEVVLERLATRTTNDFGKDPAERERILADIEEVEPLLRRGATLEVDASVPLSQVVDAIAALATG